jgi:hypothetical protein
MIRVVHEKPNSVRLWTKKLTEQVCPEGKLLESLPESMAGSGRRRVVKVLEAAAHEKNKTAYLNLR